MPFGRNLAPSMLHRHPVHGEAVARITWCVDQHAIGVITGEVDPGSPADFLSSFVSFGPDSSQTLRCCWCPWLGRWCD
jgi:hypothetical protein